MENGLTITHLQQIQLNLYIDVYRTTQIGRSIGKTMKDKDLYKRYKKALFSEIDTLCKKMDFKKLTNSDIRESIGKLSEKYDISFGQSQKAINVILKVHCKLYNRNNINQVKKELDCPLDSIVLKELGEKISLKKIIDKSAYCNYQDKIERRVEKYRIDFDDIYDKKHAKGFFN